jgi:hypothetical protein
MPLSIGHREILIASESQTFSSIPQPRSHTMRLLPIRNAEKDWKNAHLWINSKWWWKWILFSARFLLSSLFWSLINKNADCTNTFIKEANIFKLTNSYRLELKYMRQPPPLGSGVRLSSQHISRVWTLRKVK